MILFTLIMHHVNGIKISTRARKYDYTTRSMTSLMIMSHRNKLRSSAHGATLLYNYNPVPISVSMKYLLMYFCLNYQSCKAHLKLKVFSSRKKIFIYYYYYYYYYSIHFCLSYPARKSKLLCTVLGSITCLPIPVFIMIIP